MRNGDTFTRTSPDGTKEYYLKRSDWPDNGYTGNNIWGFGIRSMPPCSDCDGYYCTMNCGPKAHG